MNESKQRKAGAMLSYISIILNTVVQLMYTPFLIRMLGQSEYGLYSLCASVIGYLTVLDLGFGNAIVVYTAKFRAKGEFDKEKKMQGMFKIIFYIIGIAIAFLGVILYFNVNNLFGSTMTGQELEKAKIMMLILAFNLIVTFSFNIYSAIINAYEKFVFQKVISILNTLLKPIIMIPLLFLGFKSVTMCIVITIVNLVVVLSNYYYCKNNLKVEVKYNGFDKTIFKVMFGYSIWIFLGAIVDKANWAVDQFILGAVSGTIAVSIYAVASTINQLFISLSTAVSGVLLPKMSKMVANNATSNELTNEFIKVGRIQYYIIFLMCSGFILFGKEFIKIWAGEGFEEAYYVALFLIIPLCIPLIQNLGLSIMQAMNKFKFRSIILVVIAVFNVSISVVLAKAYGAIGAAVGTGVSLFICNGLIMNIYYFKVIKLNIFEFWKAIIKISIPLIIPIFVIAILMNLLKINGIMQVMFYGTIYVLIYGAVVYILCMNNYEKNFVESIVNKFKMVK